MHLSPGVVHNFPKAVSVKDFCPGPPVREWSLITGRGGLQNGRGGHVKFYPYEKGGRKKF